MVQNKVEKGNSADVQERKREHEIYKVTWAGSGVDIFLLIFKFAAGILGHSAAMIADAVHSLADFITDIVVLLFVKLSNKPKDKGHDYGHGKYETLATAVIGIALLGVGLMICYNGITKTWKAINGVILVQPGIVAFIAALVSVAIKEWCYRFTAAAGKKVHSEAVVANAWHHRSDALSSVGTALGIGGAVILGQKWAVLDPIAAIVVSIFIIVTSWKLIRQSVGELLDESLPDSMENEIVEIAKSEQGVSGIHNLRTRRIGNQIAIEMHLRMPGQLTLYEAHQHSTHIEDRLRKHFGAGTIITIHPEPVKINGKYEDPDLPAVCYPENH
ncbi:MAG: cation diffusion facilitator family transporter [Prevotella sp.]|jgi:cation diffusion facilitator family transporter|nr:MULTISPECIES: cation diffusion facilitator family transporter [unclassified Prevotella]MCH3969238.1 cation diffusion facilitator family transporter [Prevotella sp.]MCH3985420.1 cation diffusion facilitator family transporter [Prevotella sp.]MCH3991913.1 cation diffusion facilitator family transporter [Prevotella sp.]MCH4017519.1 cation diffusion facilitator family transporter [Prevotella sp.]MCH4185272.1 cation diffusion facilitator family transporter [Prevotella sp.]